MEQQEHHAYNGWRTLRMNDETKKELAQATSGRRSKDA
jgi:hypothetical protein